ncbi:MULTISPECIES: BPSL0761 family protein [unclassified Caballeronia]|uniref:BPSL0761 family protein n=1 Tax=unclassified Caballeronia TaxID=2646786 RepID=UPI00286B5355|nr:MULTISPECIES: BPSL0761 family protein [unclassified Caballeronia]
MTQPHERTKAVIDARILLQTLLDAEEAPLWALVRTVALNVLRHFPHDGDIALSAAAVPTLWSEPHTQTALEDQVSGNKGRANQSRVRPGKRGLQLVPTNASNRS